MVRAKNTSKHLSPYILLLNTTHVFYCNMYCLWMHWHFKPTVVSPTHHCKCWHTWRIPTHYQGRSLQARCVFLSSYNLSLSLSAYLSQNERESSKGQEILSHRKRYLKIVEPSSCWWNTSEQPAASVKEVVVDGYWDKASLNQSKHNRQMHSLASFSLKTPPCRAQSQQPSSPPC